MLNDADISWAVSLIVTSAVYYLLQRNAKVAPKEMIGKLEHPLSDKAAKKLAE